MDNLTNAHVSSSSEIFYVQPVNHRSRSLAGPNGSTARIAYRAGEFRPGGENGPDFFICFNFFLSAVPKLDRNFVTLLFPAKCLGCEEELSPIARSDQPTRTRESATEFDFLGTFDNHWCRDCWRQLCPEPTSICKKCGASLFHENPLQDGCSLCHDFDFRFAQAVVIANYQGLLQELVIRMKNQHDEQLAVQLGNILAFQILQSDFLDELNLTVPVPTHWFRRLRRGFSAAEVIAERIAKICNIPHSSQVVRCVRQTKKQGTLSTSGRFKNVRGAFEVCPHTNVRGLTILLIDDVITSGATTNELAQVLLRKGAAKVYVGVIARGARVS